jgi:hypothetical protein
MHFKLLADAEAVLDTCRQHIFSKRRRIMKDMREVMIVHIMRILNK